METKNKSPPENNKTSSARSKKLASILASAMLVIGIGTTALMKQKSNLTPTISIAHKGVENKKYFKKEDVKNEVKQYFKSNYNEMPNSMVVDIRKQFHLEDKIETESFQLISEKTDQVLKSKNNYFSDPGEVIDFFIYLGLLCFGMYGIVNLLNEASNRGEHLATKYESRDKGKLTTVRGRILKKEFHRPMRMEAIFETYSYFKGGLDNLDLFIETEEGQKKVRFCYKRGADADVAKKLYNTLKVGDLVKIYAVRNNLDESYFGIRDLSSSGPKTL